MGANGRAVLLLPPLIPLAAVVDRVHLGQEHHLGQDTNTLPMTSYGCYTCWGHVAGDVAVVAQGDAHTIPRNIGPAMTRSPAGVAAEVMSATPARSAGVAAVAGADGVVAGFGLLVGWTMGGSSSLGSGERLPRDWAPQLKQGPH